MYALGDVHGKYDELKKIVDALPENERLIQIGDMGVGFPVDKDRPDPDNPPLRDVDGWFRGNHDRPDAARRNKHYMNEGRDYGTFLVPNPTSRYADVGFYCAGAQSVDAAMRVEGVSWWRDEELSYQDLQDAYDLYITAKPEVVLTHEAPTSVVRALLGSLIIGDNDPLINTNGTSGALEHMLQAHKPRLWVFGHYHYSWRKVINGTQFICLNELEKVRI